MFDCDLQFPHAYELREIGELTGSGQSALPLHYFPAPTSRPERDGWWIEVCPHADQQWWGVFAHGYSSPPGISRALSTPDPKRMCVISGGQAYVVSAANPRDWNVVPVLPITDACSVLQHELLLFADFSRVTAWGKDGMVWQVQFNFDGLNFTSVTPDLITGQGYEPALNQDAQFVIETRTGKVLRG